MHDPLLKKKETERKRFVGKTGGGPPPEAYFKSWELDVSTYSIWFI